MSTTHELKLWAVFFEDTYRKPFELRRNDRGFQVGDRLHLREWDKDAQAYTGRECMREVIYVLPEGSPGLAEGFVGLGLARGSERRAPSGLHLGDGGWTMAIALTLFEAGALALALVLLGAAIGGHCTDSWYRNNLRRARKAGRLVWRN